MRRFWKAIRNTKGFTLVDTAVSLVLVGILLTISVVGVNEYVDYAHFKENNESARALFVATQSALTHYRASGQLTGLRTAVGGSAMPKVPVTVTGDDAKYRNRLTYVIVNQGVPAGDATGANAFLSMVGDYIYDKDMLSGTYCVELDPTDGLVYAVSYTKQAKKITYEQAGGSAGGTVGIRTQASREVDQRRPVLLGYYSTELSERAPVNYGKPEYNFVMLRNGNTLDLCWQLTTEYQGRTGELVYTINLCDQSNQVRLALVLPTLNSVGGLAGQTLNKDRVIRCAYTAYNANGRQIAAGDDLAFYAYVTSESEVRLVLDATDFAAADTGDTQLSSTSALRLCDLTDMALTSAVYARVQATGASYAASAWKQSNTESILMGALVSDAPETSFTLQNARHLYNLRFLEEQKNVKNYTFIQTASFAWGGKDGILAAGAAFDTTNTNGDLTKAVVLPDATDTVFPPIAAQAATLTAGADTLEIGNLYLKTETGGDYPKGFGLFLENTGTTEKISLTGVQVSAERTDRVGAFCGTNSGRLAALSAEGTVTGHDSVGGLCGWNEMNGELASLTMAGGSVTGSENVGGVVGSHGGNGNGLGQAATFTKLVNYARVEGGQSVGGIISQVRSKITLSGCANYHAIWASRSDAENIGGITGHLDGGTLRNCTSAPQDENLPEDVGATYSKIPDRMLYGENVGGIAGLNTEGTLIDCSVGKGFVLGRTYVGGFTGRNAASNNAGEKMLDGSAGDGRSVCRANVVGLKYVGGVTGAVGKNWTVSGFLSTGLVAARTSYAGGVAGMNQGTIENCGVSMDTASVSGMTLLTRANGLADGRGQYIGGIAGCNRGLITSDYRQNIVSVVAGEACVGGVVGLNGADADEIINIGVSGAYIGGNVAVGGFAGANNALSLFSNTYKVAPNNISGNYYVGGFIGSNLVSNPNGRDFTVRCEINNYSGSLTAGAFAGGMIGMNAVLGADGTETEQYRTSLYECVRDAENTEDAAHAAVQAVLDVEAELRPTASAGRMTIAPSGGSLYVRLSSVRAQLYAGGVLGRSDEDTLLTVSGVHSYTSVTATSYLTEGEEWFSYAGGIIGIVSEGTIVENCVNDNLAAITHLGSYHGGLTERNLGQILNCNVGSLRWTSVDTVGGVGGVAGVNEGTIAGCTQTGTVTGVRNVGGIAAINRRNGSISDCAATGTVNGSAENIGGIAGQNFGVIEDCLFYGRITGTGANVGGFVGYNEGSLTNAQKPDAASGIAVTGRDNVGGVIGKQAVSTTALTIRNFVNDAAVQATDGQAGGIVGFIETGNDAGTVTFASCDNNGRVQADKGYAGGITAYNGARSTIENCVNTGTVYAPKARNSGSIVAENYGLITDCATHGTAETPIEVTGLGNIGGVAGYNAGVIRSTTADFLSVYSTSASAAGANVGGFVGCNEGEIRVSGTTDGTITVTGATTGGAVGGAAGSNGKNGVISGGIGTTTTRLRAVVSLANGQSGAVGGIAGSNRGRVDHYTFCGSVSAPGDEGYGVGGIVGVNGSDAPSEDEAAVVDLCFVDAADAPQMRRATEHGEGGYTVSTLTSGGSWVGGNVSVGGVAGSNNFGATISNSTLTRCYIHAATRFVGGIAGYNNGTITGCRATGEGDTIPTAKPDLNVKIYIYQGDAGGLIGYNDRYGALSDSSTGFDWFVLASKFSSTQTTEATDDAIGGAIGYSVSDCDITNIVNCADVTKDLSAGKSTSAGGIIGRMENITGFVWKISSCKNYGDILTYARVGGMIGQWKYKGGTIENCENYGMIAGPSNTADSCGGIVGYCYSIDANQALYVTNCQNFGTIGNGSSGAVSVAGIVGSCNRTSNTKLYLTDCDNAGRIAQKKGGGIFGSNTGFSIQLRRCVNYYKFTDTERAALVATNAGGSLQYNVDAVDSARHVLVSDTTAYALNNFYLQNPTGEPVRGDILTPAAVSASSAEEKFPASNLTDRDNTTSWQATQTAANTAVLLTFRMPSGAQPLVHSANVFWKGISGCRYTYDFYYYASAEDKTADVRTQLSEKDAQWTYSGTAPEINVPFLSDFDPAAAYEGMVYLTVALNKANKPGIYEVGFQVDPGTGSITYPNETSDTDATAAYVVPDVENAGTYRILRKNGAVLVTGLEIDPVAACPVETAGAMARYAYWRKVQEKVRAVCSANYSVDAPPIPAGLKLTCAEGMYKADWDSALGAYNYAVQVQTSTDGTTWTTLRGEDGNELTLYSDYDELYFNPYTLGDMRGVQMIRYRVASRNAGEPPAQSAWAESTAMQLLLALPAPEAYLELTGAGSDYVYAIKLGNLADYATFDDAAAALIAVKVTDTGNNMSANPTLAQIRDGSARFTFTATDVNSFVLTAQAMPTGSLAQTHMISAATSVQTQHLGINALKTTATSNWNMNIGINAGFTGVLPTALSFTLTERINAERQVYRRTEFVVQSTLTDATDAPVVDVVLASDLTRVSSSHVITLAGLAVAPGERYTVRSYPWYSQGQALRFGHSVATSVAGADVPALTDAERSGAAVMTDGTLNPGYVLVRKDDGAYDVFYTVFLDSGETFKLQMLSYTADAPAAASTPVLADDYAVDPDDNDIYIFSWTDSPVGMYDVIATGTTVDGQKVQIRDQQSIQGENGGGSIRLDSSAWQYKSVTLALTRHNTVQSGFVTGLGLTVEKTYAVPLRLPAPEWGATPVELVSSDELEYVFTWKKVAGAAAQQETLGYRLTIADTADATDTVTYPEDGGVYDKITTIIDLTHFSGKTVTASVMAIIKPAQPGEAPTYSADSAPSTAISLVVAERIPMPTNATLSLTPVYTDTTPAIPAAAFDDPGFTLTMTATGTTSSDIGRYLVQVYVSETAPTDPVTLPDDASEITRDRTVMTPKDDNNMLAAATYAPPLGVANAGKWVYTRSRVVSDSEISSAWTQWFAFRVPKAQLQTPVLTKDSHTMQLTFNATYTGTGAVEAATVPMLQLNLPSFRTGVESYEIGVLPLGDGATETIYSFGRSYAVDGITPIVSISPEDPNITYYDYFLPGLTKHVEFPYNADTVTMDVTAVLRVTETQVVDEEGHVVSTDRGVSLHLPEFASVTLAGLDTVEIEPPVTATARATLRSLPRTTDYVRSLRSAWQSDGSISEIQDD